MRTTAGIGGGTFPFIGGRAIDGGALADRRAPIRRGTRELLAELSAMFARRIGARRSAKAPPSVSRPPMKGNVPPSIPAVVRIGVPDGIVWKVRRELKELAFAPRPVLRLSSPLSVRDAVREGAVTRE